MCAESKSSIVCCTQFLEDWHRNFCSINSASRFLIFGWYCIEFEIDTGGKYSFLFGFYWLSIKQWALDTIFRSFLATWSQSFRDVSKVIIGAFAMPYVKRTDDSPFIVLGLKSLTRAFKQSMLMALASQLYASKKCLQLNRFACHFDTQKNFCILTQPMTDFDP